MVYSYTEHISDIGIVASAPTLEAAFEEGVKAALETFKDFDTGGLTSKLTFASGDHRPNMSAKIYEYQGGKMVQKATIELPRKKEWLGY